MGSRFGQQCFGETHETLINFNQPCALEQDPNPPITYFLDLTENHNKTLINVTNLFNVTEPRCKVNVFINDSTEPIMVPHFEQILEGGIIGQIAIQVEDLRKLAIQCVGQPPFLCLGTINIKKTFCICCP